MMSLDQTEVTPQTIDPADPATTMKVIVVDDSRTLRKLLIRELNSLGITQIAEAGDGIEALEKIRTESFDLMLLDMEMPELDGFETLKIVKSTPELQYLPVIVVSGSENFEGKTIDCIKMGAEDYLPEPFDPVLLKARVFSSLEKKRLRDAALEELFEAFIGVINHAIDDKSPYTSGHCDRVPELTMMLADAVNRCQSGPLADFNLTNADRQELKIAGLLHDCGKIATPVHVVDKATKLEKILDGIELVQMRTEIVLRDIELALAKNQLTEAQATEQRTQLLDDFAFLSRCNIGGEFMKDDDVQRVSAIAQGYQWQDLSGKQLPFLNPAEITNLTIRMGTLNNEERQIINHHIDLTISMLERLPWPKHLKNVTEYAGGHHEKMDGKGYPKGLTREQMSVPARCMGIADIFEALTAKDRPYKKGKTLSESLEILGKMKLGAHVDPDLFDIFIWEKVYEEYAHKYMDASQIDAVDLSKLPGYNPPPADQAV
jgi:response regulator RpfG family c-di-GMP phosphodiesterase